jgi:hypothetical protein
MEVKEIAEASWRNGAATEAIVEHVQTALESLPQEDAPIGTTRLLHLVMPLATEVQQKAILSHIYNARVAGLLDGWFVRGKPTGGTFGKPSIKWHAPEAKPAMTDAQRRDWMRENDPETYAMLYGAT